MNSLIDERISLETMMGERWWETYVHLDGSPIGPIGSYPDELSARQGHKRWVEHVPHTVATPLRRPLRLLVAEDNPDDTQHVMEAFEPSPWWKVASVETGQAALELLNDGWNPDLFLLSINMPKLTGYDVLEMMRRDLKSNSVPIIMWSMASLEQSMVFAYEHGVFSYLVKNSDSQMEIEVMRFIRRYWDGTILDRP